MLSNSWETHKGYYNNNYYVAYPYIVNKTVPSISIISSIIGFIICVLLWRMIFGNLKYKYSIKRIKNIVIAFTFTATIGQLVTFISSIVFLNFYDLLREPRYNYINNVARTLGVFHIWSRLANSCLIFIMLIKSMMIKESFCWNFVVIIGIIGTRK